MAEAKECVAGLGIHTFTPVAGLVTPETWDSPASSINFNIVRHSNIGAQQIMVRINGHTGRVLINAIAAGDVPGAVLEDETVPSLRCTDARVLGYSQGGNVKRAKGSTSIGNVNQAVTAGGKLVVFRNSKDELKMITFGYLP